MPYHRWSVNDLFVIIIRARDRALDPSGGRWEVPDAAQLELCTQAVAVTTVGSSAAYAVGYLRGEVLHTPGGHTAGQGQQL